MAQSPPGRSPERRQATRFNISLPVTFTLASSGRLCTGMVDNISLGGVLLLTDEALGHEEEILIHIPIDLDTTVNIAAMIVRTTSVGEVGVAFISLRDEEMQRLSDFVEQRARSGAAE